jgi:hypothetical protein
MVFGETTEKNNEEILSKQPTPGCSLSPRNSTTKQECKALNLDVRFLRIGFRERFLLTKQ